MSSALASYPRFNAVVSGSILAVGPFECSFDWVSPASGLKPRLLTGLCWGAMMSLSIGLNLLPVFLTTLSELYGGDAGLTKEELGRLGAMGFGGLVLGILLTGPLADRWHAKPFVIGGNLLISVSLVAAALAPTYALLAVSLFFLGLGAGILDMVLSPVVGALHPERRSWAMNWLHSFYCVGAVVTILVGTVILKMGFGWRAAGLLLAPFPIVLAFFFAPLQFPALVSGRGRMPVRALIRRGWFIAAVAAIFLGGATELGMAQWLPAYAETSLGFPLWMGGTSLMLFSVAMAMGRMVAGTLDRYFEPMPIMLWGSGISVVLFLLGSFSPVPIVALVACIAVGFSGSCLWPTMLAVSANKYPDGGASMFGLLAAFGNAGGICMPWLVGWVADLSNLHWGLALSALAPAAMMGLLVAMRARP